MYNKAYEFADKHGVRLIEQPLLGGVQLKMMFSNGYGVSIVSHQYSYGGNVGQYELAVLEGSEEKSHLCYDTDITDDVLGWLDLEEALDIADRVSKLTKDGKEV